MEGSRIETGYSTVDTFYPSVDTGYKIVVAIDFGTSYSGYAFSYKRRPSNISYNETWSGEQGSDHIKAPTAILTDGNGTFKAFGYDAIHRYQQMKKNKENEYSMYTDFKMILYKAKNCRGVNVMSVNNNNGMSLLSIVSMLLKYLYCHFKDELANSSAKVIEDSQIKVVLTVPALWSNDAKEFMKHPAKEAEIVDSVDSPRLDIAIEPVAASYMCRRSFGDMEADIEVGDRYMVVDCGGGTVDIAMHEMMEDDEVKEMNLPVGGYDGGTKVDQEFEKKLGEIVGEKSLEDFKMNEPGTWFKMMTDFWSTKRNAERSGKYGKDDLTIKLLASFVTHCKKYAWFLFWRQSCVEDWINAKDGYSCKNGEMSITDTEINRIFNPSVEEIIRNIRSLLKDDKNHNMKYILMVGGYSKSKILFESIKEHFEMNGLKVLRVQNAASAVLKGAVLFGHFPTKVKPFSR